MYINKINKWYTMLIVVSIISAVLMMSDISNAATYKLYPIEDTYVDEHSANMINGYKTYLQVGGVTVSRDAYLKFHLDSLESDEQIISATFSIYGWWVGPGSDVIDLYHIADDSWTEDTLKWSNQPDSSAENGLIGTGDFLNPFNWLNWDLLENRDWDDFVGQDDEFITLSITATGQSNLFFFSKEVPSELYNPFITIVTEIINDDPTDPIHPAPLPPSLVLLLFPCLLGLICRKNKN